MENKKTKRILLSCAVILVIACLCIGIIVVSGVGVSFLWPLRAIQEETQVAPSPTVQGSQNGDLPEPSEELPEMKRMKRTKKTRSNSQV